MVLFYINHLIVIVIFVILYSRLIIQMSINLLNRVKYHHLKIIYTHPQGIKSRYQATGDKWVSSLGHPHVKTYYDYFKNNETLQYALKDVKTDKQQTEIENIKHAYKPGLAKLNEFFRIEKSHRVDDSELVRDVSQLTFSKFIQEGRKEFTEIHKLACYGIACVLLHVVLYFIFIYGKELPKNERVRVLNSQILQSYHFESEQTAIRKIIERVQIVNDEYEKKLGELKKK